MMNYRLEGGGKLIWKNREISLEKMRERELKGGNFEGSL